MTRLALNPHAWIAPASVAGGKPDDDGYVVVVPDVVERVLRRREIAEDAPEYDAVRRLHANLCRAKSAIAPADVDVLVGLGVVVERETITRRPLYRSPLAAEPGAAGGIVRVTLAGELRFADSEEELVLARAVFADGERFWHSPRPGRRGLAWWPDAGIGDAVRWLARDGTALVTEAEARALRAAWIVEPLDGEQIPVDEGWSEPLMTRRHYAVGHVFPPAAIPGAAEFYRALAAGGFLFYGDSARRYFSHNDRVGLLFHDYALEAVQSVVPRPIKPSYTYFSGYRNEALLVNHRDRDQCEYTLNLMLAYRPGDVASASWPLVFEHEDEVVELRLAGGESAVFEGRVLEHSRPALPPGHECDILLMHYVNDDFEGPLD